MSYNDMVAAQRKDMTSDWLFPNNLFAEVMEASEETTMVVTASVTTSTPEPVFPISQPQLTAEPVVHVATPVAVPSATVTPIITKPAKAGKKGSKKPAAASRRGGKTFRIGSDDQEELLAALRH